MTRSKLVKFPDARYIHIGTVGMINGLVEFLIQAPTFPEYANNNTYGVQAISDAAYEASIQAIPTCTGLLQQCAALAAAGDPDNLGYNSTVNNACLYAASIFIPSLFAPYQEIGVCLFHISLKNDGLGSGD
jgi:hypothetical protein